MLDKLKIDWRVGLKSLVIAVLVTVNLCALLFPLVPNQANAQAAPVSPTEQARRYQATYYYARCLQIAMNNGSNTLIQFRSEQQLNDGEIINVIRGSNGPELGVGFLVGTSTEGYMQCADGGHQKQVMEKLAFVGENPGVKLFFDSDLYHTAENGGGYESMGGNAKQVADRFANYMGATYGINMGGNMSPGSQHFSLKAAFLSEKGCGATESENGIEVHLVNEQGVLEVKKYLLADPNREVPVGGGIEGAVEDEMLCSTIVQRLDALDDLAAEEQKKFVDDGGVENPDDLTGAAGDERPTCETSGGLTWIICPVINGLAILADGVFNQFIRPLLHTKPIDTTNPNNPTFQVWVAMRNIANILLVVAMIVIVFGQAIGGGLVDAYTAKKVLPRIVAAAIMINLSIYMAALAIDVTNVIGSGIAGLIYLPFQQAGEFQINITQTTGAIGGAGIAALFAGGVIWSGAFGAMIGWLALFVLLPLVLAFLGALFTIVVRMGLIQFLVISAPIACVLYCLPNTEKYFKKWWDLFLKTLLVYPIIMIIFAIADVMAVAIDMSGNQTGGVSEQAGDFVKIVLLALPLFMIPYAFKLAGGAIGAVHGALTDRSKKGVEAIKGNANDQTSLRNKTKRRLGEGMTLGQARLVDPGRKTGANFGRRLIGGAADKFGNVDARLARYNMQSREEAEQMSATGRDALRYAAGGYKEGGKYYDSKGREISKNTYKRGKQLYGATATGVAQNLEYALRKAQTDEDFGAFRTAFARNAQQNGWNQAETDDAWAAATYPHKSGLAASEWYSSPKLQEDGSVKFKDINNDVKDTEEDGKSSYSKFISDLHKTRLSYQLPARDQDYRAMHARQTQLEEKLMAGETLEDYEATQLAQTYEVFDAASHQYSMGGTGDGSGAGTPAGSSISATAGTAAAKPIIEKAIAQRQARGFGLGAAGDDGSREITRSTPAGLPIRGGGATARNVTGDAGRSEIPRDVV